MSLEGLWPSSQPVTAIITVEPPLRVGAGAGGTGDVDLPVLKAPLRDEGGETRETPIIPASTFKGLLRNSVRRLIGSLHLGEEASRAFQQLFGSNPPLQGSGEGTAEGCIGISAGPPIWEALGDTCLDVRTSTGIDGRYGSVKEGRLWQYECVYGRSPIKLSFNLYFLYPIDGLKAGLLLAGLRLLRYEHVGGFGSKGMGLIEEVDVKPESFRVFAEKSLKKLLGEVV
ncbi:MAG: RAMP superfamily CRISPR-associated protein [Candidatus Bathyarchaeia archaeon]